MVPDRGLHPSLTVATGGVLLESLPRGSQLTHIRGASPRGDSPERATGGDASRRSGSSSDAGGSSSTTSTPRGTESRAARLAKLRQERSLQRLSTALKGAQEKEDPAERAAQAELLSILRQEVRGAARCTLVPPRVAPPLSPPAPTEARSCIALRDSPPSPITPQRYRWLSRAT